MSQRSERNEQECESFRSESEGVNGRQTRFLQRLTELSSYYITVCMKYGDRGRRKREETTSQERAGHTVLACPVLSRADWTMAHFGGYPRTNYDIGVAVAHHRLDSKISQIGLGLGLIMHSGPL